MAKAKVCDEAIQLYDYMVHNCKTFSNDFGDHVIYCHTEGFKQDFKIWLKELNRAGWIKLDVKGIANAFVLGRVETVYFRDSGDLVKEALLSRYNTQQLEVIERVLNAVGSLRKSGTLTEKQTLTELKYYNKYSCEVVIKSAQVYLNLPIDKQHGERYLHGIIRNEEAQSNGRLQKTESLVQTKPAREFRAKLNKNEWVRKNIDRDLFVNMDNDDQAKYIRQLESDYESARES